MDVAETTEAVPGSTPEAQRPDCEAVVAAVVVDGRPTRVGRRDGLSWPLRDVDDASPAWTQLPDSKLHQVDSQIQKHDVVSHQTIETLAPVWAMASLPFLHPSRGSAKLPDAEVTMTTTDSASVF